MDNIKSICLRYEFNYLRKRIINLMSIFWMIKFIVNENITAIRLILRCAFIIPSFCLSILSSIIGCIFGNNMLLSAAFSTIYWILGLKQSNKNKLFFQAMIFYDFQRINNPHFYK